MEKICIVLKKITHLLKLKELKNHIIKIYFMERINFKRNYSFSFLIK